MGEWPCETEAPAQTLEAPAQTAEALGCETPQAPAETVEKTPEMVPVMAAPLPPDIADLEVIGLRPPWVVFAEDRQYAYQESSPEHPISRQPTFMEVADKSSWVEVTHLELAAWGNYCQQHMHIGLDACKAQWAALSMDDRCEYVLEDPKAALAKLGWQDVVDKWVADYTNMLAAKKEPTSDSDDSGIEASPSKARAVGLLERIDRFLDAPGDDSSDEEAICLWPSRSSSPIDHRPHVLHLFPPTPNRAQ